MYNIFVTEINKNGNVSGINPSYDFKQQYTESTKTPSKRPLFAGELLSYVRELGIKILKLSNY